MAKEIAVVFDDHMPEDIKMQAKLAKFPQKPNIHRIPKPRIPKPGASTERERA